MVVLEEEGRAMVEVQAGVSLPKTAREAFMVVVVAVMVVGVWLVCGGGDGVSSFGRPQVGPGWDNTPDKSRRQSGVK